MESGLGELTSAAVDIAQRAGESIMQFYLNITEADIAIKTNNQDFVTRVDTIVEQQIISELKQLTPTANFLGEETGTEDNASELLWVVDPIDGTRYFARGIPMFAVMIGMVDHGAPAVGIIHHPTTHSTYYAHRGGGCFRDGHLMQGSATTRLSDAIIYVDTDGLQKLSDKEHSSFESCLERLLRNCYRVRMFGSASMATACLVSGAIDAYIDLTGMNPLWDMVAPQVLAKEAGLWQGKMTFSAGPPRLVASTAAIQPALAELLAESNLPT